MDQLGYLLGHISLGLYQGTVVLIVWFSCKRATDLASLVSSYFCPRKSLSFHRRVHHDLSPEPCICKTSVHYLTAKLVLWVLYVVSYRLPGV